MSISLSKTTGTPVFMSKSGKHKGIKFKVDCEHNSKDKEPVRSYKGEDLQLIPNGKVREVHMVVGPSGSGKSYWLSKYIKEYKKKHSKNPVYLISPKSEDECLDKLNVHRVKLNAKNWLDEDTMLELDDFEDSLVCFDDCEAIQDKHILAAVNKFRDMILLQGRSLKISTVIINHMLMDYKNTRIILSEANAITFFPSAGSTYHIKNFMKSHCGLSAQQIAHILKLPSRHVTLHKCYPNWVLTSNEFFFL